MSSRGIKQQVSKNHIGYITHKNGKRVPVYPCILVDQSRYKGPTIRILTAQRGIHRRRQHAQG